MSENLTPIEQVGSEVPDNFNAILIGGGVIFIIGLIPLLNLLNSCCLGIMLGGGTCVWYYVNQYRLTITNGEGFKLGALSGLAGGLASLVISYVLILLFDYQPGQKEIQDLVLGFFGSDPATRAQIEAQMKDQAANSLSAGNIAIGVVGVIIIYPIFAGLGGVISASVFKKSTNEMN